EPVALQLATGSEGLNRRLVGAVAEQRRGLARREQACDRLDLAAGGGAPGPGVPPGGGGGGRGGGGAGRRGPPRPFFCVRGGARGAWDGADLAVAPELDRDRLPDPFGRDRLEVGRGREGRVVVLQQDVARPQPVQVGHAVGGHGDDRQAVVGRRRGSGLGLG